MDLSQEDAVIYSGMTPTTPADFSERRITAIINRLNELPPSSDELKRLRNIVAKEYMPPAVAFFRKFMKSNDDELLIPPEPVLVVLLAVISQSTVLLNDITFGGRMYPSFQSARLVAGPNLQNFLEYVTTNFVRSCGINPRDQMLDMCFFLDNQRMVSVSHFVRVCALLKEEVHRDHISGTELEVFFMKEWGVFSDLSEKNKDIIDLICKYCEEAVNEALCRHLVSRRFGNGQIKGIYKSTFERNIQRIYKGPDDEPTLRVGCFLDKK